MNFQVIVTVGPSVLNRDTLAAISACGQCIFRINGAHTTAAELPGLVKRIRGLLPEASLMLDLPGNKVRITNLTQSIHLQKNAVLRITPENINFPGYASLVKPGDVVLANDSIFTLVIEKIEGNDIILRSHSDGELLNNKSFHVKGIHASIPFLFAKDKELLRAGSACGLNYISLSFVRTADDIKVAKQVIADSGYTNTRIIAKIETLAAVENLSEILEEVDMVNVDRGDLSADVGVLRVPGYQEQIVTASRRAGKHVFLATQFLKHMETYPVPLIAEIGDLHKSITSGISGIQLSEETSVGRYPVECVKLVFDVFYQTFSK